MSNNVENLSPQTIRGVAREMQGLVADPPEGIKVQLNEEDVTDIQAFIEGPAGWSGLREVRFEQVNDLVGFSGKGLGVCNIQLAVNICASLNFSKVFGITA